MSDGLDAILGRKPPAGWSKFCEFPSRYIAEFIYSIRQKYLLNDDIVNRLQLNWQPWSRKNDYPIPDLYPIKVVCLSDTHNHIIPNVPDGDILIHAGDLTEGGTFQELKEAAAWIQSLPHRYKIVIAGNHELCLDENYKPSTLVSSHYLDGDAGFGKDMQWGCIHYLQNSSIVLSFPERNRTIKVYGSPYTPKQGNGAFQYPRRTDRWKHTIPYDTDILITHGPSRSHLDNRVGCRYLLNEVWRVNPKLHVFGHIHVARGKDVLIFDRFQRRYENIVLNVDVRLFITIWNITILFCEFLLWCMMCRALLRLRCFFGGGKELERFKGTIAVNAAMVKGLKNERVDNVLTAFI